MVEIGNREQFEEWLIGKPVEWGRALAARAALRVFPLTVYGKPQSYLTLAVVRTLFASWVASNSSAHSMKIDASACAYAAADAATRAYSAARAYASSKAYAAAAASDAAAYAAQAAAHATTDAAHATTESVNAIAAAADAVVAYATRAYPNANPSATAGRIWRATEADAIWLDSEGHEQDNKIASRLMREPLRLSVLLEEAWSRSETVMRTNENWQIWNAWYRRRLNGHHSAFSLSPDSADDDFTAVLIREGNAFWDREPAVVNTDIGERLANALRNSLPTIPPARPAMIEPAWQNDLLTLLTSSAPYDEGTHIEEALRALRDDLREMADDLSDASNIDRRVKNYLERLADRVPMQTPTQYEIHRLGLAESNLADYLQTTVIKEWPDFLSGRMIGSMRQFDRVMRQFKSWRKFKQNAEQETLTGKDITDISKNMAAVANALQPGEEKVIDPAIPIAMTVQIGEIHGVEDEGLEFNKVLIAMDAREGARNTVKELLGKFIELLDISMDWTKGGFKKEHKETGEKVGRVIYRLFASLVVCAGVATAASVAGMGAADIFALVIKSPELLKFLDGKEGWLAALLMLLANRSGKT